MRVLTSLVVVSALALLLAFPGVAMAKGGGKHSSGRSGGSSVSVKSYRKKDGTRVQGHRRTKGDTSKRNNWSTRGNSNPYTGKSGTVTP